MTTIPQDPTPHDLFGGLLDYQQSKEYQNKEAARLRKEHRHALACRRRKDKHRQSAADYLEDLTDRQEMRREARKLQSVLLERQRGICYLCGKPIRGDCEVDHLIPLASGGTNDLYNLRATHPECNREKGDRQFIQLRLF